MKKETKRLLSFYKAFGADAQKVLDFVSDETNQLKMKNITAQEETESNSLSENRETIPDGVYFITADGDRILYNHKDQSAPTDTVCIGVKMGDRSIAVALHDLPGDINGKLQLLPRNHTSPETSKHYSWDDEADKCRFNVFEDFDGKGNTERLKEYGSKIEVPRGEWIPSIGELGLLMMHATDVNRAIELAGGKPIKERYWSSTEHSQSLAWVVYFSNGDANYSNFKFNSFAVRAVAAF